MAVGSAGGSSSDQLSLALCLSGGGYRATLFHLGALLRLNEFGVLETADVVTSVSGGSILNGALARAWSTLRHGANGMFENFEEEVRAPVEAFCARDLRTNLLFWGRLKPKKWPSLVKNGFAVPANDLAVAYEPLFGRTTLADLPDRPKFIFCATNVETGASWQFSTGAGARTGDYYCGYFAAGSIRLTEAVAASSAFPPGFAAIKLAVPKNIGPSRIDLWNRERPAVQQRGRAGNLRDGVVLLTDGGVYDNLGLEPIWDQTCTVLVSDAGRPFGSSDDCRQTSVPRLLRAADISANQVSAVRKRWLFERLKGADANGRSGTDWDIDTPLERYRLADAPGYNPDTAELVAGVRTDLNAFTAGERGCLINHGYSLANAAIQTFAKRLIRNPAAQFVWPAPQFADNDTAIAALQDSGRRKILRDVWNSLASR